MKLLALFIGLCLCFVFLGGCAEPSQPVSDNAIAPSGVAESVNYKAVVKNITSEAEATSLLNEDSSSEMQFAIVNSGSTEAKTALLKHESLTSDALVAICEEPGKLDLKDDRITSLIEEAVNRVKLTSEQEVRLANTKKSAPLKALLLSANLTGEGLVAVCDTVTTFGPFNSNSKAIQPLFIEAIERTDLTAEQEVKIAETNDFTMLKSLLNRTNLTAEGFIAVCKSAKTVGQLNLNKEEVQNWLISAAERTELTVNQEIELAKMKEFAIAKALLNRSDLSSEALVVLCEEADSSWLPMSDDCAMVDFFSAAKRLVPTLTLEEQEALMQCDIRVVQYAFV